MTPAIIGYGTYIPKYRIKIKEIAKIWGKDPERVEKKLNVKEKSVPNEDEDTTTIAVTAARNALEKAGINPKRIGAIYIGSESHAYAVKPTSTMVAEAIRATPNLTAADYEFACKAGTAGIQTCLGLVRSGMIDVGLAIGADVSQGAPGDPLEYTAGAGGAAFAIGSENVVAEIINTVSYTTDTPDFWRREGEKYPSHGGRFTGGPGYFKHVMTATKKIMDINEREPSEYDHVVFHQPNGKFPVRAASKLGFEPKQYSSGLLVPKIGNTYSGATPLGLASVLDVSDPGDLILATSYGSGAGSDAFEIRVTEKIKKIQSHSPTVEDFLGSEDYLSYGKYVRYKGKVK